MLRAVELQKPAMRQLGHRVRVMAIRMVREARVRDLPMVMDLEVRIRIVQGETNQIVVLGRLRIRFNGFEENWFLLRKPVFLTLSVGPVQGAFRPSGLVNMSHPPFSPSPFSDSFKRNLSLQSIRCQN